MGMSGGRMVVVVVRRDDYVHSRDVDCIVRYRRRLSWERSKFLNLPTTQVTQSTRFEFNKQRKYQGKPVTTSSKTKVDSSKSRVARVRNHVYAILLQNI